MPDINDIIDWESGEMDPDRELEFFTRLVQSGTIWHLQGCYQRRAADLGLI